MKNKSVWKKILVWGAILLILLVPLIAIYYILRDEDKNIFKKSKMQEITFEEVNELEEYFNENKVLINFIDTDEKNITSFNDLDNQNKIGIALSSIMAEGEDIFEDGIEIDDMEDFFKDAFYEKITWEKEDYNCESWCGKVLYLYDNVKNEYIYNPNHGGHGGSVTSNSYYSKTIDLYKSKDTYVITKVKLWNSYTSMYEPISWDLYDSVSATINKTPLKELSCPYKDEYGNYKVECDSYANEKRIEEFDFDNNYEEYLNTMDRYIYTFKKKGDDFVLKTFEYKKV